MFGSTSDTGTHPHPASMAPLSRIIWIRIPIGMRYRCRIRGTLRGVELNSDSWRSSVCERRGRYRQLLLLRRESNRDTACRCWLVVVTGWHRTRVPGMGRSVVHLLVRLLRWIRIRLLLLLLRRVPIPVSMPRINRTITLSTRLCRHVSTGNGSCRRSRPDVVVKAR